MATVGTTEDKTGIISELRVNMEKSYFIVGFEGQPEMCSHSYSWAYVEKTEVMYDTVVSTLTSAFAMGSTVTLRVQSSGSGFCHIIGVQKVVK